jgi:hypothetical protein
MCVLAPETAHSPSSDPHRKWPGKSACAALRSLLPQHDAKTQALKPIPSARTTCRSQKPMPHQPLSPREVARSSALGAGLPVALTPKRHGTRNGSIRSAPEPQPRSGSTNTTVRRGAKPRRPRRRPGPADRITAAGVMAGSRGAARRPLPAGLSPCPPVLSARAGERRRRPDRSRAPARRSTSAHARERAAGPCPARSRPEAL